MAKGEHFFVWRQQNGIPFQHHAVDLGDGTVVHFTDREGHAAGPNGPSEEFCVTRTSMDHITRHGSDRVHWVKHPRALDANNVVQRALSQVGQVGYHLVFENCEHFATWCAVGEKRSRQIEVAFERAGAVGLKSVVAATVRMASRFGVKRAVRGVSPWMLLADVAQWGTEVGGHHVGLTDPTKRKKAGRAVGGATALACGVVGGPVGIAIAGGIWAAGEIAGEAACGAYQTVREHRQTD